MGTFHLEAIIDPTVPTAELIREAREHALAGDEVSVGQPEWTLFEAGRRGWGVKAPDAPYPLHFPTAEAAATALVRGWIAGSLDAASEGL